MSKYLQSENSYDFEKNNFKMTDDDKLNLAKIKALFEFYKDNNFEYDNPLYEEEEGQPEKKTYYNINEFINDWIIGEYEQNINFLRGRVEQIKRIYINLPKLEKTLEKELDTKLKSDVSEMTKARISGIVGYIKSGQLRNEIIMPLIVLLVGLLGTDFIKTIFVKMGFKVDESDRLAQTIEKLAKKIDEKQSNPQEPPVVQPQPSQPINIPVDKLKQLKAYSVGF